MKNPKEFKVFIYMRVGNESQLESAAEKQNRIITEYLNKKGNFRVINRYADIGFSGTNFNRPSFKEMCKELDKVNAIAVYDVTRISRNMFDLFSFEDKYLIPHNVDLISAMNDENLREVNSNFKKIISYKRRNHYGR